MARSPRALSSGDVVHVFARGVDRGLIFYDDSECEFFLDRVRRQVVRGSLQVFAWALMWNHFHLLLRLHRPSLGSAMSSIETSHAEFVNRRHGRVGHLFQNRYRAVVCRDHQQILTVLRYVHLNPVSARLCNTPSGYRWSGHAELMGNPEFELVDRQAVFGFYDRDPDVARTLYLRSLDAGTSECQQMFDSGVWSPLRTDDADRTAQIRTTATSVPLVNRLADAAANLEREEGLEAGSLRGPSRLRALSPVRARFCRLAQDQMGASAKDLASFLGRSPSAVYLIANDPRLA